MARSHQSYTAVLIKEASILLIYHPVLNCHSTDPAAPVSQDVVLPPPFTWSSVVTLFILSVHHVTSLSPLTRLHVPISLVDRR
jgi:hypothetical protein